MAVPLSRPPETNRPAQGAAIPAPMDDAGALRLLGTGWTAEGFAGRTVLDVGAGSGLLSVHACRLGAARVLAVEAEPSRAEALRAVAAHHALPIEVRQAGLRDLVPAADAADVVLLMGASDALPGGGVADALARAAALARDTLWVEARDLASAAQALLRRFREVQVIRASTVEGGAGALLRARGPLAVGGALAGFREARPLHVSLARGPNAIELVATERGLRAVKTLAPNSPLRGLADAEFEALFDGLAAARDPILVLPETVGGRRRHRGEDGQVRMVLPFVGRPGDLVPGLARARPARRPLDAAVALRAELAAVPPDLVAALRAACAPLAPPEPAWLRPDVLAALREGGVVGALEAAVAALDGYGAGYDRAREDAATHADLQGGNVMEDRDGRDRVVDLDLMRTGTAWSDLLACAVYNGFGAADLAGAVAHLMPVNGRAPDAFDAAFALGQTLTWLATVSLHEGHPERRRLDAFIVGARAVSALVPP